MGFRATCKRYGTSIALAFLLLFFASCAGIFLSSPGVDAALLVQSTSAYRTSNQANPTVVSATIAPAVAGNLLIAVVGANGIATTTGPSGWTQAINQSGAPTQAIFYRTATGGETTISISVNTNPGSVALQVYEYIGNEMTLASVSSATGTGTAPSSGTVTTTDTNELLFSAFTLNANQRITNTSWNNAGEGFRELIDFGSTGSGRTAGYAGGDNLASSPGAHSVTVATNQSTTWRGQILSFRVPTSATNVTSTLANGTYGAGQVLPVTVTFSRPVTVNTALGTPELYLNNGTHAHYVSGSGTSTLHFSSTVRTGEDTENLDYAGTDALVLAGGTILDSGNNPAVLTLPTPGATGSLSANTDIAIHTDTPTYSIQYFSDSGLTQSLGDTPRLKTGTYYLKITMSEALSGVPTISIDAEGTTNDVDGATTTMISDTVFFHTRIITSDAAALGVLLEEIHLTATDFAGNTSTDAHPENMFTAAAYTDTVAPPAPVITAVSTDNFISATEKTAIIVTGTAELLSTVSVTLSDGTNTVLASQQLTGGATEFSVSLNGVTAAPLPLADGTITPSVTATDAAGNVSTADTTPTATQDSSTPTLSLVTIASDHVNPTLARYGNTISLTFDANESLRTPSVAFNGAPISVTGSGTHWVASRTMTPLDTEGTVGFSIAFYDIAGNPGTTVSITTDASTVYFDGSTPIVTQTTPVQTPTNDSTPEYVFTTSEAGTISYGGSCASATTSAISGINTIVFNALADGTYTNCTLRITDAAGNASALSNLPSFTIDTVAPLASAVHTENPDGTYNEGHIIELHVHWNESVFVTGAPSISLNSSPSATATYSAGSSTQILEFLYTVSSNDASGDLDYTGTNALVLGVATIRDAAGNTANVTLPSPGTAGSLGASHNLILDGSLPNFEFPLVLSVSAVTADGRYGIGETITIRIQFCDIVYVTGTPTLTLDIAGGTEAPYSSGSGTGMLYFTHTVRPGDDTADLDYVGVNSLTLHGGTIVNGENSPATLTLPPKGSTGSLAEHSAILLHTSIPALTEVSPLGVVTTSNTPSYAFTSNETGTIAYGGDCTSPTTSAAIGTNTISFNPLTEGTHASCTITVTDFAGNTSAPLSVSSFVVALYAPYIVSVSPEDNSTGPSPLSNVVVTFTEPMNPETFSIDDDDSHAYDAPVWSNTNRTMTVAHTAWSPSTLITIVIDGTSADGDTLAGQKSWSFTTGTAESAVPPSSPSTTCEFAQWNTTTWSAQDTIPIGWTAKGLDISAIRLSYSLDARTTWSAITEVALPITTTTWTAPASLVAEQRITLRLECLGADAMPRAQSEISFTLGESASLTPQEYVYSRTQERERVRTISDDKNLPTLQFTNACSKTSRVISADAQTIYYCGRDGWRYPFPDEATYFSWFRTFEGIHLVTAEALEKIPLGAPVTHRPGGRLVKLQGNAKVYAVSQGGVLHWIMTEAAAERIYGAHWNRQVSDIANEDFKNYRLGEVIQ